MTKIIKPTTAQVALLQDVENEPNSIHYGYSTLTFESCFRNGWITVDRDIAEGRRVKRLRDCRLKITLSGRNALHANSHEVE
jgi:signal transduction histidine kinase